MKLYLKDREIEPWELHGPGYWYVATPYSRYPDGTEAAFEEACRVAGWLIANRVHVYAPITATHPIAINALLDPFDHDLWLPADEPMMDAARGLIVVEMKGWEESYGMKVEQARFITVGKPIIHLRGVA